MTRSKSRGRRPRKGRVYPAPAHSARLYVRVRREHIGLFRFLLEAWDNLALFTVVDRLRGVLLLRFSPHQESEVRGFLAAAAEEMPLSVEYDPAGTQP
ncbi:protein of unknown function [Paucidesulfovibrio gracilis DSM 16080]|uniref:DUF4911 domain-containing protein n=1 Tax=Paucidesulfovibrio gracilis DSM 16080 TaxID=1121449 RepID=A0A1T4XY28_9BACT|nr:DUF4911 domain-containing protein [Paucidesulfovibrio gracilis]SKA94424.1 protein of unknown function [Paucidesulfovibrio gracilis DSM 16080]